MRPRVVIDTNSLLQILGAKSKYHQLLHRFLQDEFVLCITTEILFEYEEILRSKASPAAADFFLKVLTFSPNVFHKEPYFYFQLIGRDPDDNKFVDCAIVCQADFIVTDDSHFDDLDDATFPPVFVMSLDDFFNKMTNL